MEEIKQLYIDLLILTKSHDAFTIGTITSLFYAAAMMLACYRYYIKEQRNYSHLITTSLVTLVFLLSSLAFEHYRPVIIALGGENLRNIYLLLTLISYPAIFTAYSLHKIKRKPLSTLFIDSTVIQIAMSVFHFVLWIRIVPLEINEQVNWFNSLYSFSVLYLTIALGVALLWPNLLKNKARVFINPFTLILR